MNEFGLKKSQPLFAKINLFHGSALTLFCADVKKRCMYDFQFKAHLCHLNMISI